MQLWQPACLQRGQPGHLGQHLTNHINYRVKPELSNKDKVSCSRAQHRATGGIRAGDFWP